MTATELATRAMQELRADDRGDLIVVACSDYIVKISRDGEVLPITPTRRESIRRRQTRGRRIPRFAFTCDELSHAVQEAAAQYRETA